MARDRGGPKAGMWIALHDGMPDHPKIEDLSDRAFRALVTLWCWCGRHLTDGAVTAKVWRKHTTLSVRRELVEAGLVDPHDDGSVEMHDYLDWQRSSREVAQVTEAKRTAGLLGNHKRWHVKEGRTDPACEWCVSDPGAPPERSQEASHVRSQLGSQNGRREEKRREENSYGDLGGRAAEANTHEPPAPQRPRCQRHAHLPADDPGPNCVGCRDARLAGEVAEQRTVERERAERAAAAQRRHACGACDEHGWALDDDGRPLEPARRCTHATPLRLVEGAIG